MKKMARRGGILKRLAKSCKSKATNSANQAMYMMMWGRRTSERKKESQ